MAARQIEVIKNTKDKQLTYSRMLGRYKAAVSKEFYLEALLIDYAMIEDRLRSFIYYCGGISNRSAKKFNVKQGVDAKVRNIIEEYGRSGDDNRLTITTIYGKIKIVRSLLSWAATTDEKPVDSYLKALKSDLEKVDIGGLLDTLDEIELWRKYRDEVIHGVLNKNMDSLDESLSAKVSEGMEYARFLDGEVKVLKRGNKTRKVLKLQNN